MQVLRYLYVWSLKQIVCAYVLRNMWVPKTAHNYTTVKVEGTLTRTAVC